MTGGAKNQGGGCNNDGTKRDDLRALNRETLFRPITTGDDSDVRRRFGKQTGRRRLETTARLEAWRPLEEDVQGVVHRQRHVETG